MARIERSKNLLDNRFSSELQNLEVELRKELDTILHREELIWFQKSKMNWFHLGDRNITYFHAKTIARRKKNRIEMLQNGNGEWIDDQEALKMLACDFFINLYHDDSRTTIHYKIRGMFPTFPLELLFFDRYCFRDINLNSSL